ncbi:hypothetical protein WICMUC_005308 [Wickerhamomyces mucosus]|uniref:Uncharacterized protein n=1 Tax=Wickerhamomyces mucosus TaxID=1378264 RepID=A0A9P8T7B2_9ASCO|nr:hypothetical protein WICMUC_005308 [Wickerhamomyces mucosus]
MVVPSCLVESSIPNMLKRPSVSFTKSDSKRLCLDASRRNSVAPFFSNSSSSESDEDLDNSQDESCYMNNQRRAKRRAHSINQRRSTSFADDKLTLAVSQYSDLDDDEQGRSSKSNTYKSESYTKEFKKSSDYDRRSSSSSNDFKYVIKRSALDQDICARNRCFDYLVSAIDEAWALYCDATSYAEDKVFNKVEYTPNTPVSMKLSDDDDEDEEEEEEDGSSFREDGYKSASTNLTEYDSDLDLKKDSNQLSSFKLQQLKDRLLKAKYYLQDYLDSDEIESATAFWKRWDLVKYATIELVEDDDDDNIVEPTIEDLEKGRYHGCY